MDASFVVTGTTKEAARDDGALREAETSLAADGDGWTVTLPREALVACGRKPGAPA